MTGQAKEPQQASNAMLGLSRVGGGPFPFSLCGGLQYRNPSVSIDVAHFFSRGAATDNSPGRKPGESWRLEPPSPEGATRDREVRFLSPLQGLNGVDC